MKTTYYLVTGTAVAVAALVVYAQLPNLNGPLPPAPATAAANPAPPRLALPPVVAPPDEPLAMPAVPAKSNVLPALPPAKTVTPVGHTEPVVPLPGLPAVPPGAPEVLLPPPAPFVPAVPPALPAPPPVGPEVPPVPALDLPKPPAAPVVPLPAPSEPPKPNPAPPAKPLPLPAPTPVTPPPLLPAPAPLAPAVVGDSTPALGELLPGTKYVVLKDDKLIEGSVAVRGDVLVVRQGALDRSFPKGQVQYVADSKDEVYKFQLAKVPGTDVAARLKVARWCMFSGMREQALAEAREVQKLQPTNSDASALVRSLEQSLRQFPPADAPKMTPPAPPTFPTELSARPTPPVAVNEADPELTPEAAKLFATKVQPILANQCVECHAKPDVASAFKLTRVDPAGATAKATRANLWAVAGQLRKDDPATSPLLVKSLQAHGGSKMAPLARHAVAYQTLEAWVALAVGAPTPSAPAVPVVPAPAVPPLGSPAAEPVLPSVAPVPANPLPGVPAPVVPAVPAPPMIPAADPLFPAVPPAAPVLPKPPAAPAIPPIPPASGFGQAIPPKPPTAGSAGDEFDPAGFNQPRN